MKNTVHVTVCVLQQAATIIQPIILSLNHATSYLWPQGRTHTHTHIHTYTRALKVISRNQVHAWFKNRHVSFIGLYCPWPNFFTAR